MSSLALRLPSSAEHADVCFTDPCLVFEIRDFLSPAAFRALDESFPPLSAFVAEHAGYGNKRYLNNKHPEFFQYLDTHPAWRELYETFCAQDTLARLQQLVGGGLQSRKPDEKKRWVYSKDMRRDPLESEKGRSFKKRWWPKIGRTPVRLGFEFSYLEHGNSIPPHTDVQNKLLSLLLFFPDVGKDYSRAGGTEFYRAKPGASVKREWNSKLPTPEEEQAFFDSHETFYVSPFAPNKLLGFLKNDISWHGLHPLELPPGATRRSLNINIFTL